MATIQTLSDYLTDGFWKENGESRRAFDTSRSNVISVNISDLNSTEKALARAALEAWEMVADIDFKETTSSGADITFLNDDGWTSYYPEAYSTSVTSGETITSSEIVIETGWLDYSGDEIGTYGFQTYVHELGHALGLGHQSQYNGSAKFPDDADFDNDSWQVSVMSYFSQGDNTNVDASEAYLVSTMMADIVAIQELYGAPGSSSVTAGNTTWGANSNLGNYLGDLFNDLQNGTTNSYSGDDIALTVYDQGGVDTLDLSMFSTGDTVDLRDGTFSDVGGLTGNVGIMIDTVIENLKTGSGNDTITGNDANNSIYSKNGDDTISGNAGEDKIFGGNGNDTIDGGVGSDILKGGSDNDEIRGGNGLDKLYGENGDDELHGGNHNDILYGGNGNNTLYGEHGHDRIYGGADSDTIYGGDHNDLIHGREGDDIVEGGNGRDRAYLGDGNDTYIDNSEAGFDGRDKVYGGAGDDEIMCDGGLDYIRGGDGNDALYGGAEYDQLRGDAGNDVLNGGTGDDMLIGGADSDTFVFASDDGDDNIRDFNLLEDLIAFSSGASSATDLTFSDSNGDLLISYDGGTILLTGVDSSAADQVTFEFDYA